MLSVSQCHCPLQSCLRSNRQKKERRRNKSGGDASDVSSADEYFITRRQNILQSLEAEETNKPRPPLSSVCPPCRCSRLTGDSNSSSCSSTAPLLKSVDESLPPTACTCKRLTCLKCRDSPSRARNGGQTKISGQPNSPTLSGGSQHPGTVKQTISSVHLILLTIQLKPRHLKSLEMDQNLFV